METKKMKVRITYTEEVLGGANANPEIHSEFIASKAQDAESMTEEIEAIGVEEVERKAVTVFPRDKDGQPMFWDYQIKGFFKDVCGLLRRVPGTHASKLKAYKKILDGLLFVHGRRIRLNYDGEITLCQRPLRAQTMQGERIALASSEALPAGTWFECEIEMLDPSLEGFVREALDYGKLFGISQWRSSGKGRFEWEEIK